MNFENIEIKVPILFLVFNRPEKTQEVFNVIREVKPKKLYIFADAPRKVNNDDDFLCGKVRDIVRRVDWECDVKYLFQEENLGCSLAGVTAWDWIFSQEEKMIFIEDDGLPDVSFFPYCQILLDKYKDDRRIAYIGGVNYGMKYGDSSYFFSYLPSATYAMATWKRTFDLYEYSMDSYKNYRNTKEFKNSFPSSFAYKFMRKKFDRYLKFGGNTYDIQMNYLVYKYKMLSIYPNKNMISNIGLDWGGANNDVDPNSSFSKKYGNRVRFRLNEIIHPSKVFLDPKFERNFFRLRALYNKTFFRSRTEFYLEPYLSKMKAIIIKYIKHMK